MIDRRSFMSNYNILIQLIIKISISEAFTRPCNVSQQTVQFVSNCPTNLSSYEAATKNKNCSSLSEEAQGCLPLQYHCVLSEDLEHAIEVCAPSLNIIDHVCAKFSTDRRSIMRVEGLNCSKCPYSYNSTLAYKYAECYSNLTQPLETKIAQSTTQTNNGTDITKDPDSDVNFTSDGNIAVPVYLIVGIAVVLGIIFLAALIYFVVKKRRNVPGQSRKNDGYASVSLSEPGRAEYYKQCDDDDEHVHSSQSVSNGGQQSGEPVFTSQSDIDLIESHNPYGNNITRPESEAGEIELTSPNVKTVITPETGNLQTEEGSVSSISPDHQETSSNEGTWFKASMKTTISSSSENDQSMLEGVVNLLLLNLENPDVSWTKEKIICHVKKTIQQLINSKAEQLFTSFINRLCNDKKIATTLLKCGEEMFKLISSIQERYTARKIEFTDGCVCVTFCFANDDDLTNYLEKVLNKDEELITDLSRILLNKTLLSVFNIDPDLVSWTAHDVKVYKGSQSAEKVLFQESLIGSSKDFSEATETYEKKPFSKSTELSDDFEEKCDMFSSEEKRVYPGYSRYNVRAMTFDDAKDWLKVKKKEFAKFGFLYKGTGLNTACFCCGCFKDDWTEEDNIFETHVFLKKSCAYIQFINALLMEQE